MAKSEQRQNTNKTFKYCDIALKELESTAAKKTKQKTLQNKKNKNTKHFFKMKKVFLLFKSLHVM